VQDNEKELIIELPLAGTRRLFPDLSLFIYPVGRY
jgi:hypothetical protein